MIEIFVLSFANTEFLFSVWEHQSLIDDPIGCIGTLGRGVEGGVDRSLGRIFVSAWLHQVVCKLWEE